MVQAHTTLMSRDGHSIHITVIYTCIFIIIKRLCEYLCKRLWKALCLALVHVVRITPKSIHIAELYCILVLAACIEYINRSFSPTSDMIIVAVIVCRNRKSVWL